MAIPNAGRTRAVRSLGAAATTVLETLEPDAADTEPQLGLPLWELEAGMCWFAVNEVPTGKGLDLQFCGRPVVGGDIVNRAPYALTIQEGAGGRARISW